MGLIAHFPFEGTIENVAGMKALSGATDYTEVESGFCGSCVQTGTASNLDLGLTPEEWDYNSKSISFGGWFKFNQTSIASVVNNLTYSSTAYAPTGILAGYSNYGGLALVWSGNNMTSSSFNAISVAASLRTSTAGARITNWVPIEFDTWTHLFLVYNKTTSQISIFKNGILASTVSVTPFSDGVNQPFYINFKGAWGGNGPSARIPFQINDFRIYDQVCTGKEIYLLSKGLIAHYRMNTSSIIDKNTLINYVQIPPGAYIDTGYIPNQKTYIRAFFSTNNNEDNQTVLFGAGTNFELFCNQKIWQLNYDKENPIYCGNPEDEIIKTGYNYWLNLIPFYALILYDKFGEWELMTDYSLSDYYYLNTFEGNNTLYIGASHRNSILTPSSGTLTLYQFQISEMNDEGIETIIHLYKPRMDIAGNACLYDEVTKTIIYSASSVDLIAPTDEYFDKEQENLFIVQDCSGLNHNAEINSQISINKDNKVKNNYSTYFDGINSSITVPFSKYINDANYTINFWFKKDDFGTKENETLFGGSGIQINSKNSNTNQPKLIASSWGQTNSTGLSYSLQKWHMVTISSNSTATKIYLDGVLGYTGSAGIIPIKDTDYFIGAYQKVGNTFLQNFKGYIADFRIYHSVFSDTDIMRLYQSSVSIDKKGQIYSYNFVEDNKISLLPSGTISTGGEYSDNYSKAVFFTNQTVGATNLYEI